MTTFLATAALIALVAALVVALGRHHQRTYGQPHAPLGADAGRDADLYRVLHDLGASGRA